MPESLFNSVVNDNLEILNVEIGAGAGNFGEKFFPKCYLTDIDEQYRQQVHYICSGFDLPWPDSRFDLIISCNPWNYGFINLDEGSLLLLEFYRVLKRPGKIIIIGHDSNPYCSENQIRRTVEHLETKGVNFSITLEKISSCSADYPNHIFSRADGGRTIPNQRLILER
ncbi:methyltransferase domain-containing protein [Leptospira interrogans]|uniref:methyltransferase domain-containing protein n=1 Tax=Leptospira interrogans TaxID=173 RepID=UPI000773D3D4|nr:methyltransferase domain-containing protein [Leptospira interrogans]